MVLKRMFGKGKSRRKPANAGSSGRMAVCDGRVITNKHVYSVRTLVRGNSAKVVHDAAKFVQLGIEVFDKLEQTNSKHMTHNFTTLHERGTAGSWSWPLHNHATLIEILILEILTYVPLVKCRLYGLLLPTFCLSLVVTFHLVLEVFARQLLLSGIVFVFPLTSVPAKLSQHSADI